MTGIPVEILIKDPEYDLRLSLLSGKKGLAKLITSPRIQKQAFALTGYFAHLHNQRIQVFGATEIDYLKTLPQDRMEKAIRKLCEFDFSCIVVTKNLEIPKILIDETERSGIPLLRTPLQSSMFISRITKFLENKLAPETHVHGVLLDVLDVGILIMGKSGIGKSECALDLILRGHRLVADDVVTIQKIPPKTILGKGSDLVKYHLEIRGLGILNIQDLFGITAIRDTKKIELVIELVSWDPSEEYDRLGITEKVYTLLGVDLPYLQIPVSPGRNVATIVQVAARNQLLKFRGHYSAREFLRRQTRRAARGIGKHRKEAEGIE